MIIMMEHRINGKVRKVVGKERCETMRNEERSEKLTGVSKLVKYY